MGVGRLEGLGVVVSVALALSACSQGQSDSAGQISASFGGGTGGSATEGGGTTNPTGFTSGAEGSGDSGTAGDEEGGGCVDEDGDGYGSNCAAGADCNDANPGAWSELACETCIDEDGDGWFGVCDDYPEGMEGPDCDDTNGCVWTEAGCANCVDGDDDNSWVGCDVYGDCAPGPDCDDANASVGESDIAELCNGIAENCAGEVDPFPADQMCPPEGVDAPAVTGWDCAPEAPGEDGCIITGCETDQVDLDGDGTTGCECEALPASTEGVSCEEAIDLGDIGDNAQSVTVAGNAAPVDRVTWYRFRGTDSADTACDNYHVRLNFLSNPGEQYAFAVGRGSCGAVNLVNQCNDYRWATDFRQTIDGQLTGQCPCSAAAQPPTNVSACENDTSEYFVAVFRVDDTGGNPTCAPYQLAISNGVYDTN